MIYKLKGLFQTSITVIIIFLLLFLGFTPLIYAKEETQEYTLMAPSLFGIKKQKINLTSVQSTKLDSIFDNLYKKLQKVESFEETKILYRTTIDTLCENGLLSRTNALLTKKLLFSNIFDRFYSTFDKKIDLNEDIRNSYCYISGEATNCDIYRPFVRLLSGNSIGFFSWVLSNKIFSPFLPDFHFADIAFGYYSELDHDRTDAWSKGWVHTSNIFGNQSVNGTFRGGLSQVDIFSLALDFFWIYFGVYFFIGIGYYTGSISDDTHFMGRAYKVRLYEKPSV